MNTNTKAIVDVFHGFAKTDKSDLFARLHVHGLNVCYLNTHGYDDEATVLNALLLWIYSKPYTKIIANGAHREAQALNLNIEEAHLLPWDERQHTISHRVALRFKDLMIPVHNTRCSHEAHSYYRFASLSKNLETNRAKTEHSFHCALYDCYELYLHCIMK